MIKIIVISFLFLTIYCDSVKNHIDVIWLKEYQINGSIYIHSITKTNDNGFALCGDEFYIKNPDSTLIWKFNKKSDLQWVKKYPGSNEFNYIKQTADNGFIVSGSYEGERLNYDMWILKLDSLGNIQWDRKIGDENWDKSHCVVETEQKNYILCGTKDINTSFDSEAWLVEFDSTGQIIYNQTFGVKGYECANSIIKTKDNGFLIVGIRKNEDVGDKAVVWILKLDEKKNILWDKNITFPGFSGANSVVETEDGSYILCGYSYNVEDDAADILIIKIDINGEILWQKFIGKSYQDFGKQIIKGNDDEFVVIGTISEIKWYSKILTLFNIYTGEDLLIIKLNANGDIISQLKMQRNLNHFSNGIIKYSKNEYILCGIENINKKRRKIIISKITNL